MSRSDGKAEQARQREQRLALKLRENLRRRKAQLKARDGAGPPLAAPEEDETAAGDGDGGD